MNIQTVLGPIDDSELGRTLVHEHILVKYPGVEYDPTAVLDRDAVVAEGSKRLRELREAHGVRTFVDPCPIEMGRDVRLLAEISKRSGVHIVCTTGFYFDAMGIPPYWRHSSVEQIADFYCSEIEQGIQGTGIRAGAIKCATGGPVITPAERKCLSAACLAQQRTGIAIITHTQGGQGGPEQQSLFAEQGLPLQRALIGHCCESADRTYHRGIVERGSYIGFDRIGYPQFQSDDVRADCLVDLHRAGYGAQILISQDRYCHMWGRPGRPMSADEIARMKELQRRDQWPPPFTYLFTDFLPKLLERGLTQAQAEQLLDENPRRFFRGDPLPRAVSTTEAAVPSGSDR